MAGRAEGGIQRGPAPLAPGAVPGPAGGSAGAERRGAPRNGSDWPMAEAAAADWPDGEFGKARAAGKGWGKREKGRAVEKGRTEGTPSAARAGSEPARAPAFLGIAAA